MKSYDERARDILQKRDAYNERKASNKNRLVVITALVLVTAMLAAGLIAIANRRPASDPVPAVTEPVTHGGSKEDPSSDTGHGSYNDGVIGEKPDRSDPGVYSPTEEGAWYAVDRSDFSSSPKSGYSCSDEAEMVPGEYPPDPSFNAPDAKAGTLTAGEWKDADEYGFWKALFQNQQWTAISNARSLHTLNMITVTVTSGDLPCFNVKAELLSGDKVLFTARTDINGKAYLFYNVDKDGETPDAVAASGSTVMLDGKKEVKIEAEESENLKQLDLLLMIDTTGSMGDELEYIKAELADMVKRISEADEAFSIRISVNFYRDEGDDYVVKYYDFRTDVKDCLAQLENEHASGGGDTPEAVHTALENAVTGHQWRNGAVKICFIVLDAPPHSESEIQGINENLLRSVKAAAEQGIRIIPVASSGVDTETEFLLRSYALMTGGTYIFLTNHSGIGFDHKEAEVGDHTVEPLNECMIRVVCEYCGIYHGEKVPYTQPHPDPDGNQTR
ncbi:MAG: VWA domain-containing protein [Clostridia bacterium]|nr:VWA domain-containing protein [Clostridia bacterium]